MIKKIISKEKKLNDIYENNLELIGPVEEFKISNKGSESSTRGKALLSLDITKILIFLY